MSWRKSFIEYPYMGWGKFPDIPEELRRYFSITYEEDCNSWFLDLRKDSFPCTEGVEVFAKSVILAPGIHRLVLVQVWWGNDASRGNYHVISAAVVELNKTGMRLCYEKDYTTDPDYKDYLWFKMRESLLEYLESHFGVDISKKKVVGRMY